MTNVQKHLLRLGDFCDNRRRENHVLCRGVNEYLIKFLFLLPSFFLNLDVRILNEEMLSLYEVH